MLALTSAIALPQPRPFNAEAMANVVWYSVEANTWPGTSGMLNFIVCLIGSALMG